MWTQGRETIPPTKFQNPRVNTTTELIQRQWHMKHLQVSPTTKKTSPAIAANSQQTTTASIWVLPYLNTFTLTSADARRRIINMLMFLSFHVCYFSNSLLVSVHVWVSVFCSALPVELIPQQGVLHTIIIGLLGACNLKVWLFPRLSWWRSFHSIFNPLLLKRLMNTAEYFSSSPWFDRQ